MPISLPPPFIEEISKKKDFTFFRFEFRGFRFLMDAHIRVFLPNALVLYNEEIPEIDQVIIQLQCELKGSHKISELESNEHPLVKFMNKKKGGPQHLSRFVSIYEPGIEEKLSSEYNKELLNYYQATATGMSLEISEVKLTDPNDVTDILHLTADLLDEADYIQGRSFDERKIEVQRTRANIFNVLSTREDNSSGKLHKLGLRVIADIIRAHDFRFPSGGGTKVNNKRVSRTSKFILDIIDETLERNTDDLNERDLAATTQTISEQIGKALDNPPIFKIFHFFQLNFRDKTTTNLYEKIQELISSKLNSEKPIVQAPAI